MLDPVAAHIKLVQGDNILWKVIADTVVDAKLSFYGIFRGQQVSHLYIQLVPLILTYEVNLFVAYLADSNSVAPTQETIFSKTRLMSFMLPPNTASRMP